MEQRLANDESIVFLDDAVVFLEDGVVLVDDGIGFVDESIVELVDEPRPAAPPVLPLDEMKTRVWIRPYAGRPPPVRARAVGPIRPRGRGTTPRPR